jgi:hypothetical protein
MEMLKKKTVVSLHISNVLSDFVHSRTVETTNRVQSPILEEIDVMLPVFRKQNQCHKEKPGTVYTVLKEMKYS